MLRLGLLSQLGPFLGRVMLPNDQNEDSLKDSHINFDSSFHSAGYRDFPEFKFHRSFLGISDSDRIISRRDVKDDVLTNYRILI